MKKSAVLVAAILALAVAAPAFAKDLPSGGMTREDVLKWLQEKGYTAKIEYDETAKDNYVSTSSNGLNWSVYLYSCSSDRCTSIQYSVGWDSSDLTDHTLNIWNTTKRFIRAYHGQNGIFGEYDIDIQPGGTWEMLDYTLDRWKSQLTSFKAFIEKGDQ